MIYFIFFLLKNILFEKIDFYDYLKKSEKKKKSKKK